LQVAHLILRALSSTTRTSASISAAALDLVAALGGTILSPLEHRYAIRPSAVLSAYLFITVILDIAVTRTLWLALPSNAIPSIFTSRLIMKIVILVLESRSKTGLLFAEIESPATEDTGNIFSRILFLWLNSLLWKGNRYELSIEDLPIISSELSRADKFLETWKHGMSPICFDRGFRSAKNFADMFVDERRTDHHRLLQVLVKDLKWPILAGLIPRLGVIGFKYVQPFMIRRMIRWLDEPSSTASQNEGYGLIAAFGLVFIGLAVSNLQNQF
jgi:ATP-binding cassette subfamily C (CFTR/MRP) protein 1